MRRALPLLVILLLAGSAEAQTRASEAAKPKRAAAAAAQPRRPDDPAANPYPASVSLQRLSRSPYQNMGGSACRTTCAQAYYFCLADGDGDCGGAWSQCNAACPQNSSGR